MPLRTCDRCGGKMAPYRPRKSDTSTGEMLCEGCQNGREGRPLTGSIGDPMKTFTVYRHGDLSATHDSNQVNAPDEPQFHGVVFPDGTCAIRWCTAAASTAVWESFDTMWKIHGHDTAEDSHGTEIQWHVSGVKADAPYVRIFGNLVKTSHASPDPAVINHCYSCGSGQVIGRSDGTCECEFCGACFVVQVHPKFPMSPQTDPSMAQNPAGATPPPPGAEEEDDNSDRSKSFGGDQLSEKVKDDGEDDDSAGDKPENATSPFSGDEKKKDKGVADLNAEGALLVTPEGLALPVDSFMANLALRTSKKREETLQEVKDRNAGG